MDQEKPAHQYDFSDWELGEDAMSEVEIAVFELIDQARDNTLRLNWPDFANVHAAVLKIVRDQLASAFHEHRSGCWTIDVMEGGTVRWFSEVEREGEGPPSVTLRPRQIIPLLTAPLAERLSKFSTSDSIEANSDSSYNDDFDWNKNWELALRAAKEWHRAILGTLTGLKALQRERRERIAEARRTDEPNNGDDA